jgi:hypothetical protein
MNSGGMLSDAQALRITLLLPTAFCLLLSASDGAFCLLLTAYCFLLSAFCFLLSAFCLLLTAYCF